MNCCLPAGKALPASAAPFAANYQQQVAYREFAAFSRQAAISLTTAEGDVVTIRSSQQQGHALAYGQQVQAGGHAQSLTMAGLDQQAFAISVQGDLNEEELRDIERLLGDLTSIAGDFFNGDYEQAMAGALVLGDMGSIAKLQATFIQTSMISQQAAYRERGPALPAHAGWSQQPEQLPAADLFDYGQVLQARWQQLQEWLDERATEAAEARQQVEKAGSGRSFDNPPPSQQMLEQIQATMSQHPRLSPLAGSLVNLAIDRAAAEHLEKHPALEARTAQATVDLKACFAERLNDWLLA
ncbi:hypothetical protein [Desulfurivibrio dismutans]|uniref:hypothetical protein n=1 Tax=Desulfurivibrio dismutans TaxID=1398908 RepID=UPI0023DBD08C|nr:hypothetical protein [Desulfurivibrio alkaliphilus]MDF1615567.1 hypothetical protein [Desulfurivibrio alkaliphilus]